MLAQQDVSAVYARLLLQSGLLPTEELLAGTGLELADLAEAEYLGWQPMAGLLKNVMAARLDPAWAAKLGEQIGVSAHGALGFAALSAPTLGAALEVIATFLPIRVSSIGIELERKGDRYVLRLFDRGEVPEVFNSGCEIALKTFEVLIATLLGTADQAEVLIHLARPRPEQEESLRQAFASRLEFAAGQNAISVPAKWWQQASPLHDDASYRTNLAKCQELLNARQQQASCAHAVRELLRQHFERQIARDAANQPPPTLEQVASHLHMTSRTLIRHLNAENQSYKILLRNLRRDYARSLLGNARLTVAEVGEVWGYR
ncbi:MAG TPA: AraC family transcriptional regulator ligand-binding domain-containing protein [Xanthomonadales bacterium]|nr:AraC family transcriptional regulator ligand-binding domain-containing protein [Xanthomonadales bacterium]